MTKTKPGYVAMLKFVTAKTGIPTLKAATADIDGWIALALAHIRYSRCSTLVPAEVPSCSTISYRWMTAKDSSLAWQIAAFPFSVPMGGHQ